MMTGLDLVVSKDFPAPENEGLSLKCSRGCHHAEWPALACPKTDQKGSPEVTDLFQRVLVGGL